MFGGASAPVKFAMSTAVIDVDTAKASRMGGSCKLQAMYLHPPCATHGCSIVSSEWPDGSSFVPARLPLPRAAADKLLTAVDYKSRVDPWAAQQGFAVRQLIFCTSLAYLAALQSHPILSQERPLVSSTRRNNPFA